MPGRRKIDVPCLVEIEQTPSSLHAHAIPDAVAIRPGDTVIVHGAPRRVPFGARLSIPCRATIVRAGPLRRAWTHLAALFELTGLYEVGFQPKELS